MSGRVSGWAGGALHRDNGAWGDELAQLGRSRLDASRDWEERDGSDLAKDEKALSEDAFGGEGDRGSVFNEEGNEAAWDMDLDAVDLPSLETADDFAEPMATKPQSSSTPARANEFLRKKSVGEKRRMPAGGPSDAYWAANGRYGGVVWVRTSGLPRRITRRRSTPDG